ncbi:hypothetical protein BLNAU_1526 [Blattamonas nauphoetae]|uniref:Uncharacterized protein n=1 Tax=Blattamonas nauphoetae TaxID=2049346 RepID=A0ABQ9YI96_9EUKA|nr:hypothetical protein BLNAU_1526 [Blattamonas nauphoetae]
MELEPKKVIVLAAVKNKLASFSSLFPPTPSFPSLSLSPHPPTPRPPVATKAPLAAPQKAPKRATTAKHRPNQHCPQQVPTPTAPSRSSARRRYLRPHITSSSSSRRATQKARSTHTASLAVWERRAGRECCLTVLSLVIGRFVADHFNEKGVGL